MTVFKADAGCRLGRYGKVKRAERFFFAEIWPQKRCEAAIERPPRLILPAHGIPMQAVGREQKDLAIGDIEPDKLVFQLLVQPCHAEVAVSTEILDHVQRPLSR